jgi:hypothetical protein
VRPAYNDFVLDEWCPAGPRGMFVPTIISHLWDPELGAGRGSAGVPSEAPGRCRSREPGAAGAAVVLDRHWDPVWQACQDHDIVLCLHIGTSGQVPVPDARGSGDAHLLAAPGRLDHVVGELMMSPFCRKYPG